MKLISMVDYVLGQIEWQKENNKVEKDKPFTRHVALERNENYAKFLSMPLTLGMFVPTDEDGNVLEEPEKIFGLHWKNEDYNKAVENVVFKGFTNKNIRDYIVISYGNRIVWISWNKEKKVQDLLYLKNLTLTQSAITKYQI